MALNRDPNSETLARVVPENAVPESSSSVPQPIRTVETVGTLTVTPIVPIYNLSDSTGITAETLSAALTAQFPGVEFQHRTYPFIATPERAQEIVRRIEAEVDAGRSPIVCSTTAAPAIRDVIATTRATLIDLLGTYLPAMEATIGQAPAFAQGLAHGLRDAGAYHQRMQAVEYAIEHDDGQSFRAIERADVILLGPSRCGKTPTTMYLALQHGIFVANYPLTDDDFPLTDLPEPIRPYRDHCFGITTTPLRLAQIRGERRPNSGYASLEQCTYEIRQVENLYRSLRLPCVSSATKSVEEMSAIILQDLRKHRSPGTP